MIRVRMASADDLEALVEFVRDHWSATHVFVDRPDVFAWQHQQADGRFNMVLAEQVGDEGTSVLGVLGFIPMGRFDPALGDRDVTLAIWKVRETGVPPGLGLRLLKFLQADLAPRFVAAIGISDIVKPLYGVLRYEVGTVSHVALFDPARRDDVRVARNVPVTAFEPPSRVADPPTFTPVTASSPSGLLEEIDDLCAACPPPVKSWRYLRERFVEHPWFRYELRAVRRADELVAVVVWRAVAAEGTRILRVVDIVGDTGWLPDAAGALVDEVVAADAEYLDLVEWGTDIGPLVAAGFVSPSTTPELVLPNYFAPFESRNVAIDLAYRSLVPADGPAPPVRLYRADSDQDRPNRAADLPPPL